MLYKSGYTSSRIDGTSGNKSHDIHTITENPIESSGIVSAEPPN